MLWRFLQESRVITGVFFSRILTRACAVRACGTQWTENPTTEYEDWGKTRLPAISTAVFGCPGLGDEDSL